MAQSKKRKAAIHVNDLYENLNNIKDAIAETGSGVKSQASEMISDLLDNLKSKGSDYQEEVEDYVSDQPLKSLGLALLAGIVIGKVIL